MGERVKDALRVVFDVGLKLEFHGAKVTSDGGLIPYRELDESFGLTDRTENLLRDRRTGKNTQHTMTALLRQSIYSRLAGYEDPARAERLPQDATFRLIGSEKIWEPAGGAQAGHAEACRAEKPMLGVDTGGSVHLTFPGVQNGNSGQKLQRGP